MKTKKNFVVGIGEILWDLFPTGKQLGGAPSNFAFHMAQLGFESQAISAIGKDTLGEEALLTLADKPMNKYFPVVAFPTGTVEVTLDKKGIPSYEIKENVAWDNIPFTEELANIAAQTCCICFGSLAQRNPISRQTIIEFIEAMPQNEETLKVFDINLRQQFYTKEIIEQSILRCNVLKINDEELETITPLLSLKGITIQEKAFTLITRFKLKFLILTCGTNGSYVFSKKHTSFLETPEVKVVDTVGAGDSFTAAFCGAILKGKAMNEAHKIAVSISAYICTQQGAMPSLNDQLRNLIL
ncbi:MAG: carbohydrate kinase [Massilibacteroides sp.]|nr:carbohydrate kinase [Massilibacteroides sp.]